MGVLLFRQVYFRDLSLKEREKRRLEQARVISDQRRSHLVEKQPTPCSSDMNQESYARMSAGIEASEALQEWRRQRLLAFQEPIKALLDSHLQAQNAAMAAYVRRWPKPSGRQ
jgi:hypothetical protein